MAFVIDSHVLCLGTRNVDFLVLGDPQARLDGYLRNGRDCIFKKGLSLSDTHAKELKLAMITLLVHV